MTDAKAATSAVLEPDSDDESDVSSRRQMSAPAPAVSEEELYPLVSAAKKARVAGGTAKQVRGGVR